jgi:MFS family permease
MLSPDPSPRGSRAVRLLIGASSASMLGTRITAVAYPMLMLYLGCSPTVAGLAVFAVTVPGIVVGIPAGVLADRWDPRRTMLISQAGRGAVIAAITALAASRHPPAAVIITLAVTGECLKVLTSLAERRYLRCAVPWHGMQNALARKEARTHAAVLAGRPVGGLLFELGPACPFLADAVSCVCSLGMLARVKASNPGKPTDRTPAGRFPREVHDGLHWLGGSRPGAMAVALSDGMTIIAQALIIIFLADAHADHLATAATGAVLAVSGAGGALGAVAVRHLRVPGGFCRVKTQPLAWLAAFAALAVAGPSLLVPCMAAALFVLGFTGAMANVELDSFLAQAPAGMQASAASAVLVTMSAAAALGPVLGGCLMTEDGSRNAIRALLVLTLACALFATLIPHARPGENAAHRA